MGVIVSYKISVLYYVKLFLDLPLNTTKYKLSVANLCLSTCLSCIMDIYTIKVMHGLQTNIL